MQPDRAGSRVLIIGAQGVLGTFLSRAFSEAGWSVTRAGRRPDPADDYLQLDLDDAGALAAAIGAADLTINTARHRELGPERAVLSRGGVLIDLAELSGEDRELLRHGSEGALGLVVPDAGLSGVAYLALAELIRRHPDADSATYMLMFSAAGSSGRAGARFGHALLTDCRHHETALVKLPRPWGRTKAMEIVTGSEAGALPVTVGGVPLRHYLTMQPRALQWFLTALNAARLISVLPAPLFTAGTGKVPGEPSVEPVCEYFAVHRDGRVVAASTVEGRGYYALTSASILTFAEAILAGPERLSGLRPIEQVLDLEDLSGALARRGVSVKSML